jgi:HPt (histidine-containing phosphotransfer) domain-containing protein
MKKEPVFIDMQYLNQVSPVKEFQKKIFSLFRDEVRNYETAMIDALEQKRYTELADLAHKAKSSVSILGMKQQAEKMKQLQTDIMENRKPDSWREIVLQFIEDCRFAVLEIDEIENQF